MCCSWPSGTSKERELEDGERLRTRSSWGLWCWGDARDGGCSDGRSPFSPWAALSSGVAGREARGELRVTLSHEPGCEDALAGVMDAHVAVRKSRRST